MDSGLQRHIREITRQVEQIAAPVLEAQRRVQQLVDSFRPHLEQLTSELSFHAKQVLVPFQEKLIQIAVALEEDRKRLPETIRTLARHGWYVPPTMSPRATHELAAGLSQGRAAEVESAMVDFINGELDEVEESLCGELPKRERFFRSAFAAHRRGDYAASIPLMLLQADGMCRDYTGHHLFQDRQALVNKLQTARPFVLDLLIAIREPMPLGFSEKQRVGQPPILNRHAVMHGQSLDYDSLGNSCRAVSLLAYLDWALAELNDGEPAVQAE